MTSLTPRNPRPAAKRRLSLIAAAAGIAMGVLLPVVLLAGFGWLWLWERGYALHWVFATLVLAGLGLLASFVNLRRLDRASPPTAEEDARGAAPMHDAAGRPAYTPREESAWTAVEALAEDVDPNELNNREAVLSLGVKTVETVAQHIHPDTEDPVWRFTVPEALTIVEQVSARLKPMIADNIPLGDQLSVGQVIQIYRWRGIVDLANRAYDIWRIVRVMNPIAAATQEVRERLTKTIYAGVREELAKRLAAAYVREVGRAAIDLYGGRLKVGSDQLAGHVSAATDADRKELTEPAEPLRILVAGQSGAGKSSLVNALAGEIAVSVDVLPTAEGYRPVQISRAGLPEMILTDAPDLPQSVPATSDHYAHLLAEADASDLIIWVAGANRADRQRDKAALEAIRDYYTHRTDRRAAVELLVVSHIDLLRPAQEWSPPYDLSDTGNAKARSIAEAVAAVAEDLGFEPATAVPVCVAQERGLENVDLVWAKIAERLPDAKRAQLVRILADATGGISWRRVLGQAAGAGRLLAGALKNELKGR